MADFYINVFLDDAKLKQVEDAGIADQITEIDGKKAIQVGMTKKDKKKLLKGYDGCTFDDSNVYSRKMGRINLWQLYLK